MSLRVTYDLHGCHGVVVGTEQTRRPSVLAVGIALLGAVGLGVGVWTVEAFLPTSLVVGFVLVLGWDALGSAAPRPDPSLWFAVRKVERAFTVRNSVLALDAPGGPRSCALQGALVRPHPHGVRVIPRHGDPLELCWDDPRPQDVRTLVEALRSAIDDPDRVGSPADVPVALGVLAADGRDAP